VAAQDRLSGPTPIDGPPPDVAHRGPRAPLAVVILTHNEEENLPHALASVTGWAAEVWVVDAGSADRTVEIARRAGAQVVAHAFAGYAAQRNWALRSLPFGQEWVLFLDADEAATPGLRAELAAVLASPPREVAGYYVRRRFVFLGRWLRHGGYYPVWLLRVVRHRLARCEDRGVDEHLVVDGPTARLAHDLLHEDRRPLSRWVERHVRYAELAAADLERPRAGAPPARWRSSEPSERARWWYERVYLRVPLGLRALAYFAYRYVLRGGFLDGREGLVYHVLQGLWYRVLVDAKIMERRLSRAPAPEPGRPAARPEAAPLRGTVVLRHRSPPARGTTDRAVER